MMKLNIPLKKTKLVFILPSFPIPFEHSCICVEKVIKFERLKITLLMLKNGNDIKYCYGLVEVKPLLMQQGIFLP